MFLQRTDLYSNLNDWDRDINWDLLRFAAAPGPADSTNGKSVLRDVGCPDEVDCSRMLHILTVHSLRHDVLRSSHASDGILG